MFENSFSKGIFARIFAVLMFVSLVLNLVSCDYLQGDGKAEKEQGSPDREQSESATDIQDEERGDSEERESESVFEEDSESLGEQGGEGEAESEIESESESNIEQEAFGTEGLEFKELSDGT